MTISLKKINNILLKPKPSKWGKGISLLWRGNLASLYFLGIKNLFDKKNINKLNHQDLFLFESARVAIYQYANFINLNSKDSVQILGFTCDAVTKAIEPFGSEIILYDCDENLESLDFKIDSNTKLIIAQNTFGIDALSKEILEEASKKGIHVLIDKSLSYGSDDFKSVYSKDYPEIFSFEVSKSFTIGWGGILKLPNKKIKDDFTKFYKSLNSVRFFNDLYRVFLTILNLLIIRRGSFIKYYFWLMLRIIGFHRLSAKSSSRTYQINSKLGKLSKRIFISLYDHIPSMLIKSNKNHELLRAVIEKKGFKVISRVSEKHSVPRIAFLVNNAKRKKLEHFLINHKIEMGLWFDSLPMKLHKNDLTGANKLFENVVNLPCHFSLNDDEIDMMISCIQKFEV